MQIDSKTKRDLELFQTRNGRSGVFQTLDRTKTPGGRRALRFRFENPMSDINLIQQVQDGVRFLLKERVEFDVDPNQVVLVERYLNSSWEAGSEARGLKFIAESMASAVRYGDLLQFARSGVRDTQLLLSQLIPLLKRIRAKDPPSEVRRPVENLLALIDRLRLDRVRHSRLPWTILRADKYLRRERRADFHRFFGLLFDLDALIGMAQVVGERGYVFPEFTEGPAFSLEGEGVTHPFLENPVGNPANISGGAGLVFLTGPNMSGKTTYLKAVAISAFLAHLGLAVPAKRLRLTPLRRITSSLSPEENLWEGLSYFMAEVRRVREVAEWVATGDAVLVVIDEAFRGTNLLDAVDASRQVIQGFAKCSTSGFIFASHLVELAAEFEDDPRVRLSCFEGDIITGRARYEFSLREGVSDQRFGMQLLAQEGIPEILGSIGA